MKKLSSMALALASLSLGQAAYAESAFAPGEQTVLRVDYSGIRAGTATLTVGNPVPKAGTQAWPIVASADTAQLFAIFPLHDQLVTWWDFGRGRSVGWDFSADENRRARREQVRLNVPAPGKATVRWAGDGIKPVSRVEAVNPRAQDITAALFTLRNMPMAPGATLTVPIFTGHHQWDLTAQVGTPAPLEVPAGTFDAVPLTVTVHFAGKLQSKRALQVWLSNDAHHALLQIKAELAVGTLRAVASAYRPGIEAPVESSR